MQLVRQLVTLGFPLDLPVTFFFRVGCVCQCDTAGNFQSDGAKTLNWTERFLNYLLLI